MHYVIGLIACLVYAIIISTHDKCANIVYLGATWLFSARGEERCMIKKEPLCTHYWEICSV